jgi:hypothetical protein
MKTIVILLSGLMLISAASKRKLLFPQSAEKYQLLVNGKKRTYYMPATDSLTVQFNGPCEIVIHTRTLNIDQKADFGFTYRTEGLTLKTAYFSDVKVAKNTHLKADRSRNVSRPEKTTLRFSRGAHQLVIYKNTEIPGLIHRVLYQKKKRDRSKWFPFEPTQSRMPVFLLNNESEVKYHRFSGDQPLVFSILGPARIRVLTRIENHFAMKGRVQYRLTIKEDNQVIRRYQLNSLKSQETTYKSDKSLTPGKAREVFLEVPDGHHQYQIFAQNANGATVLGRILINEESLSNAE